MFRSAHLFLKMNDKRIKNRSRWERFHINLILKRYFVKGRFASTFLPVMMDVMR